MRKSMHIVLNADLAQEKGVNYAILDYILEELLEQDKREDGYSYVSAEDIFCLTGLTRKQQDSVFRKMQTEGRLDIKRNGQLCKRYFKLVK